MLLRVAALALCLLPLPLASAQVVVDNSPALGYVAWDGGRELAPGASLLATYHGTIHCDGLSPRLPEGTLRISYDSGPLEVAGPAEVAVPESLCADGPHAYSFTFSVRAPADATPRPVEVWFKHHVDYEDPLVDDTGSQKVSALYHVVVADAPTQGQDGSGPAGQGLPAPAASLPLLLAALGLLAGRRQARSG